MIETILWLFIIAGPLHPPVFVGSPVPEVCEVMRTQVMQKDTEPSNVYSKCAPVVVRRDTT